MGKTDFSLQLWVILLFYFLIFYPAGFLIGKSTEKWRKDIKTEENLTGLENAGMWIGRLERILVMTFILIGSYQAIGFLVAAKSIFRFGDITNSETRQVAEYILIGTLASVTAAIILGIVAKFILNL